jgi:hypothetical protein
MAVTWSLTCGVVYFCKRVPTFRKSILQIFSDEIFIFRNCVVYKHITKKVAVVRKDENMRSCANGKDL